MERQQPPYPGQYDPQETARRIVAGEFRTSTPEPEQKRRHHARRWIAGAVGGAVLTGGIAGGVEVFSSPDTDTETVHDIRVPGAIDMGEVGSQLGPAEFDLAKQKQSKEFGLDVVPLSEYSAKADADKGDLALENSSHATTLSPDVLKTFDTILDSDKTTINYLVKSRQLSKVRFSMATDPGAFKGEEEDGRMRFIPAHIDEKGQKVPTEAAYVLPRTGKVTAQAAATMIRHELRHIVTRPLDFVDKKDDEKSVIPEETYTVTSEYAKAIGDVRSAAIEAAEHDPDVQAAAHEMIEVNKGSSDALALAQTRVAESLLDGTFDTLQPTAERPSNIKNFEVDEGRLNVPSFVVAFDRDLTGKQLEAATPAQKSVETKVDNAFNKVIDTSPASPLAALKESTYLNTSPNDGHPGDNTSELVASTMNVVTTFPQQVAAKLKSMPTSAKQATLSFIKKLSKDTQRVVNAESNGEELSKQISDAVDWVEKNAA